MSSIYCWDLHDKWHSILMRITQCAEISLFIPDKQVHFSKTAPPIISDSEIFTSPHLISSHVILTKY